jgi:hypothetical protein
VAVFDQVAGNAMPHHANADHANGGHGLALCMKPA